VIEAPEDAIAGDMFSVTVKVGKVPHKLQPAHHIQFIDLYAGDALLGRITFTPIALLPKATWFLILDEPTTLRAIAFCNMHGFWESVYWIRVD